MITPIPNQPIRFPATGENSLAQEIAARCDLPKFDFCQISQCNDEVNFQVLVDPTDKLGWFIRNTKTNVIVFLDDSEGHVTYNLTHTVAWVTFHWEDLLPGACDKNCFEICIFNIIDQDVQDAISGELLGPELILNGDYADSSVWDLDNCSETATISAGVGAEFVLGLIGTSCMEQPITYIAGRNYKLTYDVDVFVDIGAANIHRVITDSADLNFQDITSTGSKTFEFIADATDNKVKFFVQTTGGADFAQITQDDVSLKLKHNLTQAIDAGLITLFCSEPINVQTSFKECTLLMRWTNFEDAFDFEYTSFPSAYAEFSHVLRIEANLWHPIYPKDKKNFTDSSQVSKILYSNTSKRFEVETFLLPEYLHDALSIGMEHDSFEILDETKSKDFVKYVALEEDYEPVWEDDMILGRVAFGLIKGTPVKRENRNC